MHDSSPISSRLAGIALLGLIASPLHALETVTVDVIGGDPALKRKLENSSVLVQALDEQKAAVRAAEPKWYMPWRRKQEPPELPSPADTLASARAEYKRMVSVLYGEGYYGGVVNVMVDGREAADIPPLHPPSQIRSIVITVKPGPAFLFSEASVKPLAPDTTLPKDYARGEVAKSGVIGDAATTATTAWRQAGYPKVDLAEEDITANHANARLASRLTLAPGPRLRFGPEVVSGNNRVRTDRIIAIAGLPTGDIYDPDEVDDAAERLRRSGAFRSVSIREAEEPGPGDQIPMLIDVIEDKRRRIGVGAAFSTQEGATFEAFWMHRNLFGGAENLRFSLEVQNIGTTEPDNGTDYLFSALFVRPATFNPDVDALLRAKAEHEDNPGYKSNLVEIGGGAVWHFSDTLQFTGGIDYRASHVEDAFGDRQYQMVSFPLDVNWDTRDNELDPTKGFYLNTTLTPFAGVSNMTDGSQLLLDGRTYLGFGEERRTVLAGRLQYGSLFGPEIPDAPQDYLFFAGGGGSVRGQPYESLGAGTYDGQIYGGRSYVAVSGELRSYVWGNIGLVGFYDAGYVGASEVYDGSGNWMSGAGIGVRYKTGFGPIRVDVATPVSGGPSDADKVQLYIGIGQAF